jgi:hypothetical protein
MPDEPLPANSRPAVIQFTLGSLFLLMTWLATVCIGLNTPNRLWAAVAGSLALLALLTAVMAAIYAPGSARAFALGFAVFGSGYLVCLHRFDGYAPQLATPSGETLFRTIHSKEWSPIAAAIKSRRLSNVQVVAESRDRFLEIYKSAATVLMALLGGLIGRFFFVRRKAV